MVKPWLHTTLNHLAWTSREGSIVNFDDSATTHPYFGAFKLLVGVLPGGESLVLNSPGAFSKCDVPAASTASEVYNRPAVVTPSA